MPLTFDTQHRHDPRFDDNCGKFDEGEWRKSYGFLDEYRSKEITELKKLARDQHDDDKKKNIQRALSRLVCITITHTSSRTDTTTADIQRT